MLTNFYDTNCVKELLKETKGYINQKKSNDEICELLDGSSCDCFIFDNEEIAHITIKKTRFVGRFLKKNVKRDKYGIKKIKQDMIEESIVITIDYETKDIIAETGVIVEYNDGYIEKKYYKIADIKF